MSSVLEYRYVRTNDVPGGLFMVTKNGEKLECSDENKKSFLPYLIPMTLKEEKDAFLFIRSHLLRFSSYPSIITVAEEIRQRDSFDRLPEGPIGYWVDKLKNRHRLRMVLAGIL